jgi:hypothetical protein
MMIVLKFIPSTARMGILRSALPWYRTEDVAWTISVFILPLATWIHMGPYCIKCEIFWVKHLETQDPTG